MHQDCECSVMSRAAASASKGIQVWPQREQSGLNAAYSSFVMCFLLFLPTQGQAYLQKNVAGGGAGAGNEGQSDGKSDATGQ